MVGRERKLRSSDLAQLVEELTRLGLWIDPAELGRALVPVHREDGIQIRPDCGRRIVTPPSQRHRPVAELTAFGDHSSA